VLLLTMNEVNDFYTVITPDIRRQTIIFSFKLHCIKLMLLINHLKYQLWCVSEFRLSGKWSGRWQVTDGLCTAVSCG